jgi:hypothetical protein
MKKTLQILMIFSGTLIANSCGSPNTKIPEIQIKTWAGDYREGAIVRAQDNAKVSCRDSYFDNYVCLSYEDLKKIYETLLICKDWGASSNMMPIDRLLERNQDTYKQFNRKVGQ